MSSELGNGPDDWRYQQYVADDRADGRWAVTGFAVIRGIVAWLTGRDPILERRRQRLARDQAEGAVKYASLEKEAYDRLGRSADVGHRDRAPEEQPPDQA